MFPIISAEFAITTFHSILLKSHKNQKYILPITRIYFLQKAVGPDIVQNIAKLHASELCLFCRQFKMPVPCLREFSIQ